MIRKEVSGDRHSLAALTAKYRLEPSLRDVYVEGPFDKAILVEAFSSSGRNDIGIYEIECVAVDASRVSLAGEDLGAKGRVVALAKHLEATVPSVEKQVICLVDADTDRIRGVLETCMILMYSDGTSFDGFMMTPQVLERFLRRRCGEFPLSAHQVLRQVNAPLRKRFAQRLALQAMGKPETGISLRKDVEFRGRQFVFREGRYKQRLLQKAQLSHREDEFDEYVRLALRVLTMEMSQCVHISDFLECLHICMRSAKPKRTPTLEMLRHDLVLSIEGQVVAGLPETVAILRRLVPPIALAE